VRRRAAAAPLALARPRDLPGGGALVLSTDPDRPAGPVRELAAGEGVVVAQ
jgi:hypothetical protein